MAPPRSLCSLPPEGALSTFGRPGGTELHALNTEPNLEAPDDFYEALLDAHHGISDEQSHDLNARLVLLLANQIGRLDVLKAALAAAREGMV